MATEVLQEYCDSRGATLAVDPTGVIRGVRLVGLHSRNGREYPRSTLQRAAALYEGAKVNVNHPVGNPTGPRDYRDRLGLIRNVTVDSGGLKGDFHFNPKHALAEQLIWDAQRAPENVGFSHNVEAKVVNRDGKRIVEEITRVQSVDLVADPATTRGLFEGEENPLAAKRRLVNEVAEAINMPRWAVPPMETGLSYRHSRDEITEYLLDIKRILIQRGILEAEPPAVTDAKSFARAVTTGGTEGDEAAFAEVIGGKPATSDKFDAAAGISRGKRGTQFAKEILK
jgi:hypothetical protein